MREIARAAFLKAVSAVDPYDKLKSILHLDKSRLIIDPPDRKEEVFPLDQFDRIFLVGTGKASSPMAKAIEEVMGDRIFKGLITTKYGHGLPLKYTEVIEAGHPIPDQKGLEGAQRIKALLQETGPKDLVFFLLSGGGSALLPLPAEGITLEEKQELTQLLLDCGADIKEINTIRKHLSQIKGGWLARWAYPSTVITFILSDVVGDPLDVIGSGPTVPDPSTFNEAWEILKKYDLIHEVAPSILEHLRAGVEGKLEETPKVGDRAFEKVRHLIIGSNILALMAAEKEISRAGFNTLTLSSSVVGETREAARFHGALVREVFATGRPVPRPACLLSGGETTVTIRGTGLGGRNQEFVLAGAIEIDGLEKTVLLSGGTDGTDGPTDAAGALADHRTIARAREMGLDPLKFLQNNDSYRFFERLGDLLVTGPTRTNVMDIHILLID
ncbi:MAG: glycerate kinase [Desulfobacterota bacterium]|nr:glycerate kinase [Thermodesulfobacteriota bacterium]